MNYTLAKKLKDAGFPYKWGHWGPLEKDNDVPNFFTEYPTLSELIEACGDEILSIEHVLNGGIDGKEKLWWSSSKNHGRAGETIEESVVELWLALNEK